MRLIFLRSFIALFSIAGIASARIHKSAVRSAISPHGLLQTDQLFTGQFIGGRQSGALASDITDEAWDQIVNCDFYFEDPGTCYPTDVHTPCRYCKAKTMKVFGTRECPGRESFPDELAGMYEWRLKPHKKTTKFRNMYLCVVHQLEERPQGQYQQHQQYYSGAAPYKVEAVYLFLSLLVWMLS